TRNQADRDGHSGPHPEQRESEPERKEQNDVEQEIGREVAALLGRGRAMARPEGQEPDRERCEDGDDTTGSPLRVHRHANCRSTAGSPSIATAARNPAPGSHEYTRHRTVACTSRRSTSSAAGWSG